jgi:hypothetical protein
LKEDDMEFNGLNLQNVKRGEPVQVGWLIVHAPFVRRQLFEFAAWFRDHQLQPGRYPVIAARTHGVGAMNGDIELGAEVPTKIVDACFTSGFGGVLYGPDTSGPREIGTDSSYTLRIGSAHHVRACLNPQATRYWDAGEGQGPLKHSSGSIYAPTECSFEWLPEYEPTQEIL